MHKCLFCDNPSHGAFWQGSEKNYCCPLLGQLLDVLWKANCPVAEFERFILDQRQLYDEKHTHFLSAPAKPKVQPTSQTPQQNPWNKSTPVVSLFHTSSSGVSSPNSNYSSGTAQGMLVLTIQRVRIMEKEKMLMILRASLKMMNQTWNLLSHWVMQRSHSLLALHT